MLSTSYQAFKILELLRLRCGLTARDTAIHVLAIDEATYSRLSKSLSNGGSVLRYEMDIKVQIGLKLLVTGIENAWLPLVPETKIASIDRIVEVRTHLANSSSGVGPGIQRTDRVHELDQLISRAKSFIIYLT